MADGDQLHHLVSNLIINAEHAMRDTTGRRVLSVSTGYDAAAKQIVLTVADTGPGVPDDILARIFEPFFTTKGVGEGTGLSLDIAQRIVTTHQGQIEVQSRPGRTVFRVRLPVSPRSLAGSAGRGPSIVLGTGASTGRRATEGSGGAAASP